MELPFLKNKQKQGGSITMKSEPVQGDDSHLKRAIAREMWDAIERKDEESFLASFEALVIQIQNADQEEDME